MGPCRVFRAEGSYDSILNEAMWAFIFCTPALLPPGRYRDEELLEMVEKKAESQD